MTGQTISYYRIRGELCEGGMAVVYEGEDPRLDRTVAIKVLRKDKLSNPQAREHFKPETRAVSILNDPPICILCDSAHRDGVAFLVVEYVDEKPLKGLVPVDEGLRLGAQFADARDPRASSRRHSP